MPTIDDKVVAMSFESSKFESGVSATLSALDKLKAALKFPGAGKGLEEVNASAKKINLGNVVSSLDEIKGRLSAFRLTAIAVFAEVAQKALAAGTHFAKAFTLDPIKAGFTEYTTNLNAVQTILANTQASGAKLKDVNAALYELNKYSDKTIYNFAQMAKNIGTFTAAGVDLKTSTAAIKGIANLAALSGSNAEQAATAMYQLSQAISAGRVGLQDWNSVVNAGMGGAVFQRALAQTAEAMGVLEKGAVKLTGPMKNVSIHGKSFRESMMAKPGQVSWLTSDVLTNTLKQFTSDMSVAELKAQGFNDAQIKAIQATATTAMKAATEVKTISQVLDVAKEAAGSGWAQTWQIIFGNFGEAKTLFTGVSNAVNGFINASANARNKVLGDWKALGGRTVLIEAIKTTFEALGAILKPIKEAFRDIFPAKTGKDLYALTLQFRDFAEALKPSPETINNLKRTFRGLFALLDIGKQVLSGIFTVFGQLFTAVGGGSGSFLNFTGNIGDFLVALDKALKKGDGLQQFFAGLGRILAVPLKLLGELAHALATLFDGFSPGGFSVEMGSITKATKPFQQIIENIAQALQGLGPAIGQALAGINWETILAVVRTGLFAGLVLMLKKFIGGTTLPQLFGVFGKSVGKSFGAGILGNVSKSFGSLSGSLKTMQNELKAKTLKEIAVAIALLAAAVLALSLVNPERLSGALGAMTIMFGELIGAMALLDKVTSSKSFIKLPVIAASMILLAGAIDLLVIAVVAMSKLSWNELIKGLSGVGVLLTGLSAASGPLSKNAGGMIRAGIGITAIALALKILAGVIAEFGAMSWTELGKGLGAVAIGLIALTAAANAMPKGMVLKGAGLIAMATGLKILADAVAKFGSMDWKTLERGLAGVGGSLVVIAGAMHLMPKNMVVTAAGLILVAASLNKIVDAVAKMGGMSIEKLAKGLTSLAAALGILAIALHAMSGTMGGALALGAAATGIALLVPGLIALGKQSWTQIVKGMVALAAGLGLIAAAGLLLGPAVPALLGFGAALVLVGGGLALAGAGIALIGVGLSAIAVAGPAAIGILVGALIQLTEAIPEMAKNVVVGLLEIVKTLAATAPQFLQAMLVIISSMLDAVIQSAPKIAQAFEALLLAGLQVLANNQDKLIAAGFSLLLALLNGIKNNIAQIVTTVADIIVKFLASLSANMNRIVTAGAQLLAKFLLGIANNLATIVTAVGTIITKFLEAIATNLVRIVAAGANIIVKLLSGLASKAQDVINAGTELITKVITGIGKAAAAIVTAAADTAGDFIRALVKAIIKLENDVAQGIIDLLNGTADVLEKRSPEIALAMARVGSAVVVGLANSIRNGVGDIKDALLSLIPGPLRKFAGKLGISSPSTVFYEFGQNIVAGLSNGITANQAQVTTAALLMGNGLISSIQTLFQTGSPSKVMYQIGQFVGQGFAQGIRGSTEDIKSAFAEMNTRLTEAMTTARETISSEQEKLDKLRESKKPDAQAIKEAQTIIDQNEALLARSTAARQILIKGLQDEKQELIGLSAQYENVGARLEKAQQVLAQAIQTRDEAAKGFTTQYSTLPTIPEDKGADSLAAYEEALTHQIDAVGAYKSTLEQLRQLGLDDATYQKLLTEGTADQEFANQLLAGGRTAVESLNTLDSQLMKVSKTLATNAAKNLYQAGVDAAQGLVDGLKSKHSEIRRTMEEIAREILAALKRELKIKSPSEVLAEIGQFTMEGLASGIRGSAKTAIDAMRETIRKVADAVTNELNMDPTITPILDLTQVRNQAQELTSLLNKTQIMPRISYDQASKISSERTNLLHEAQPVVPITPTVKFEQNNYSPEALSAIEIYRQTRNQLSQFKSALALT